MSVMTYQLRVKLHARVDLLVVLCLSARDLPRWNDKD